MKKYLMTGVAALALCAGFTSCSHDEDFEPITQDQIDKAKYDQAFLAYVGGKIASNQDWGFSSTVTTRALGDYDRYKGSWAPTYEPDWTGKAFSFPTDCDASKFISIDDVPNDVPKVPEGGDCRGGTYYIDSSTEIVNMNTGAGVIYVKGEVDLSSDDCFEVTQNTEIYLPEGSKLKIGVKDAKKLKVIFYIAPTATLETAEHLKMDNTSKVYNHGTIKAGSFEVNNTSFLYNVGTLETTRGIHVENSNSAIVNDGIIKSGNATTRTGGDVEVAGSGHVQNNAEWTVYGSTIVNSNSASWINNGHWTTEYYKYTAGSENVINNCFLEVKEDFDINLGSGGGTRGFKIDAGGGVLTKNFNGGKKENESVSGPYRIMMGSKSVFKVTGTAALAAGNPGYGFYGPANGDYAVFQATHIVKAGNETDKKVEYGGNLYVSADDHFASEYDPWNKVVTFVEGFTKENIFTKNADDEYSTGKPNITIDETPCNPGFGGGDEIVYDIRIMGEDLSAQEAGDFDFNDIVLDVKFGNPAKLCLRAAGGTLPLRIAENDEWEVHKLFGVGEKVMVNTGAGKHKEYSPVPLELNKEIGDAAAAKGIKLEVKKNGVWQELTAKISEPAAKIAVPAKGDWLNERASIKEEKKGFVEWATENKSRYTWWTEEE